MVKIVFITNPATDLGFPSCFLASAKSTAGGVGRAVKKIRVKVLLVLNNDKKKK